MFTSAETDTTGMLSTQAVWCQQSEFVSESAVWSDSCCRERKIRVTSQTTKRMDTHVGLNAATRVCGVYPDKCWFAVLCRFWLQCSRTLRRKPVAARLLGLRVRIPQWAWMSLFSVVCFQVEVFATGRSLVTWSPIKCCVPNYE